MLVRITSHFGKWAKFVVPQSRSRNEVFTERCLLARYFTVQNDISTSNAAEISKTPRFFRTKTLNDGVEMPNFGLGVWKLRSMEAILWALENGYRLIDTASRYGNESDVGEAVRKSGLPRNEVFVVTKLYDTEHGFEETLQAFYQSLDRLGFDYVDQYLIHSPVGGKIVETWEALIKLKKEKHVRSIGVSNFGIHHLEELRKHSDIIPSVNQIEVHPYLQELDLVKYCKDKNIHIQAYRSLVCGAKVGDPVLISIGKKHGKTPAQVLIRWCVQKDYCCIPKSEKKERISENMKVFDFCLDSEDLQKLDNLEEELRSCHYKIKEPWTG